MPKKTYTVKEVANLLGFSTNTVYKYLDEGKIKSTRLGKEGRFRIPDSEVSKLLQEGKVTPIGPQPIIPSIKPANGPEIPAIRVQGAPSLFDWFVAFLSISLGFSQFMFPSYFIAQASQNYLGVITVFQAFLFIGGFALIGLDITKYKNSRWHKLTHFALASVYLVLAIIFIGIGAAPNAVGYLAVSSVIFLAIFFKVGQYTKFLAFINLLLFFVGLAALIWPGNFFFAKYFGTSINTLLAFFVVWVLGLSLSIFLTFMALKRSRKYIWIVAGLATLFTLIYATFSFTNGLWGRAIFCVVLASFSILFPFSDHFESFTLRSKKELLGSFIWLLGLFLVGSVVLFFVYRSFESYAFAELTKRVTTAGDIVTNFMNGNVAKISAFADSAEIIDLMSNQGNLNTKATDNDLKQLYQAANSTLRRVILINKNGIIVDTYPYNLSSQGVDVSDRDYYKSAKSGLGPSVSGILAPSSPGIPPAVLISVPIIDRTGVYLGTLTGSANLDELARRIGQVKFGANGTFLLADADGNYIIPPTPDKILTKAPEGSLIIKAVEGKSGNTQGYDIGGTLSLMAYKKIDNYGWGIVAQQPFGDVFAPYSLAGFVIFLVFIVSGVGSLVLVIHLRKKGSETLL